MTRALVLKGDSDSYFALDVKKYYTEKDLVDLVESTENGIYHFCDEEFLCGTISIVEFGEIDPMFIHFLNSHDYLDYDQSKHQDFILLEDN